ncbi:MAG: hypothetical protein WAV21_03740 [Minisyncoccia bacterium]
MKKMLVWLIMSPHAPHRYKFFRTRGAMITPMARTPIFEWYGREYAFQEKSPDWYWALGIIAVAAIVASILFSNLLLALVILAGTSAIAIQAAKHPRTHRFAVTDQGLEIDDHLYVYDTMLHYSVLEYIDPSIPPALSIKTRSILSPHLIIPLVDVDADAVYEYLSIHLEDGKHEYSFVDRLVEMFQL